jgi:hypothetical protein
MDGIKWGKRILEIEIIKKKSKNPGPTCGCNPPAVVFPRNRHIN